MREFITRDALEYEFCLERAFVDRWLAGGEPPIPQIPHIRGIGKAIRFHGPSVTEWLLKYFQRGGDNAAPALPKRRGKEVA